MAPVAKRRRVLGPHARPRVRRPRTWFQRGFVGKCTEGVGSGVIREGAHPFFPLLFFRFIDVCVWGLTAYDLSL
jgi:hypothetical protein